MSRTRKLIPIVPILFCLAGGSAVAAEYVWPDDAISAVVTARGRGDKIPLARNQPERRSVRLASSAPAACLDLKRAQVFSFEGVLTYRIFPGPPNYADIRKGDRPEPTYILKLDQGTCATGDEFVDPNAMIDRVQIFPAFDSKNAKQLWRDLRRLKGSRVSVEGSDLFGAQTGHHHAPLVMGITAVVPAAR